MKRKPNAFDIITLVLLLYAFSLNLFVFVPIMIEQINFGAGTQYEMFVLYFWLFQLLTVPALLTGIVYTVVAFMKKFNKSLFITNVSVLALSLLFIILSNIFIFN